MDKVGRRLNAVKVVIDLLNHELDLAKAERNVNLQRERLEASVATLEMFVEDIDTLRRGSSLDDRKVLETARPTAARMT